VAVGQIFLQTILALSAGLLISYYMPERWSTGPSTRSEVGKAWGVRQSLVKV
jgi:hypothetical protein